MAKKILHLIPNAHLDPVWLWDWREGLNEGISTVRAVVGLMDEFPELTFIRGEASIYRHVERYDPATFSRIASLVKEGRWDLVGGNYVQPDTNLPATEWLLGQFEEGQSYFQSRFGRKAEVAWAADSFGHSAGWPAIYAAAGLRRLAYSRPAPAQAPHVPARFQWAGPAGKDVLVSRIPVGWYGSERGEMPQRLERAAAAAAPAEWTHFPVWFGLGDHGGGPTRRQIYDIFDWRDSHPEVEVRFSTLTRFFEAFEKELSLRKKPLPRHEGELNFCLRGCYASASRFKFSYRRAEAELGEAIAADAIVAARLGEAPADFAEAKRSLLFNSFHDVLPGTSVERAMAEQQRWVEGVRHAAAERRFDALNRLAASVDTTVLSKGEDHPLAVPVLLWNGHARPWQGFAEAEVSLDYRFLFPFEHRGDELELEIRDARGRELPYQVIEHEHHFVPHLPWRRRVLVPTSLGAFGWQVISIGWKPAPGMKPGKASAIVENAGTSISNGILAVSARVGATGIQVKRRGQSVFGAGGLRLLTVEDPWGPWGGHYEEAESFSLQKALARWKVTKVRVMEKGPFRHALWVRLEGGASSAEFVFRLERERETVEVVARVNWQDDLARLKLELPCASPRARYEVPGGEIERPPGLGEVPGGRWVRVSPENGVPFNFASNALYCFNQADRAFQATIVRSGRHAWDAKVEAGKEPWQQPIDRGDYQLKFSLDWENEEGLPDRAALLERPIEALTVPASPGELPRAELGLEISPATVQVISVASAGKGESVGLRVTIQSRAARRVSARLRWADRSITVPGLAPGEIRMVSFPAPSF